MMRAYPNLKRGHLVPAKFGRESIGHFGFFREGADELWREPIAWLDSL